MADNSTDDMIIAIGVDLATIRRGLKKLEQEVGTSTGRVQKQFESVGRGIDNAMTTAMQNRINAMVGVGTKGAKEWTGALADQGKELERLRAKYSPLFATINSYKAAQADIRRAHAVGAISANEMTSALSQQRQEALKSIAAIKARNSALSDTPAVRSGQGFQTANIAAQFQDIAVTSAMGMSPLQIALQQGTQLSAVLGTMGSGRQVIAGLGAAFASLVSPVSLVTIGLIAGGAALAQYVFSSKDVKSADDILKGHAETIALLKDRYGDAAKGLQEYARESTQVAKSDLDERLKDARKFVAEQAKITASFGPGLLTGFASTLKDMDPAIVRDLRVAFADLSASVARGEPDILRFREALSRIANNEAVPESIRKMAEEYRKFDDETLKVAKSIPSMLEQLKLIEGVANGQTDAINKLAGAMRDLNKIGVAPLTDLQEAEKLWQDARRNAKNREERDDADMAYRKAVERIANANPTINNADGKRVAVPVPGDKPSPLDGDGKELKKQETAAQKAANAYRDLIKSANDRIGQLQLEVEITGQYGVATDAARFRLELLQQAEDKGRSLSDKQRAEIEQKVALYEKYSQALAETKLQQDLMNQARFSSLSKQDQQIVTTLRQYGLSEDLGGKNAQAIRQSLQQQEISDGFKSFAMQFSTGLISEGKSLGEAFGDAVKTAAASAMQKSLESLFSQIGHALASALMPKLGGSGTSLAGSAGSAALSFFPSAPGSAAKAAGVTKAGVGLSSITSAGGLGADVNSAFASQFQGFINDLEATGYKISSLGGYNYRNIRGTNKLSNHAYGNAIDINPMTNPDTGRGGALITDMPSNVSDLAAKHGLAWGGDWNSKKDAMHFEVAQAKSAGAALEKLAGASNETTSGLGSLANGLTTAVGGSAGGGGWLKFLSGTIFSGSGQLTKSGGVGLFADGGAVSGPGGPRTDSIPALLSNGEFVINAGQTKKHRALLEAINSGRSFSRYADGGIVAPAVISTPRAPRLNPSGGPRVIRNESALTVQIQGANGDDHVRMLVKQGVNEALAGQNEQMRRGGFGSVQASYQTDKG